MYKGTVPGHEAAYTLDRGCVLQAGHSTRVSGNTAAILCDSWLAPHFEVRAAGPGAHCGTEPCLRRCCQSSLCCADSLGLALSW